MRKFFFPLLFILLLTASYSKADEIYLKYGISPKRAEVKIASLGYRDDFFWLLSYQMELGYFKDPSDSARSSGYAASGLGVEIDSYLYGSFYFGPALISCPDNLLAGNLQFNTDLTIGLKDKRGLKLGVGYKHLSNAGIKEPNIGREFVYMGLTFPI
jgi:hypothetical protein